MVPERSVREKGYSAAVLAAVYARLESQDVRDVFLLQCFTGLHTTEVARVARSNAAAVPQAKLVPVEGGGEIAGVLSVWHKRGSPHRISLSHQAWAAARRLQDLGAAPRQDRLWRNLRTASKRAGVPQVRIGEVRHSFVALAQQGRWATADGSNSLSLADVAEVTGHRSTLSPTASTTSSKSRDCWWSRWCCATPATPARRRTSAAIPVATVEPADATGGLAVRSV